MLFLFSLFADMVRPGLFKRSDSCYGRVSLPRKYNKSCGSCILISCGKLAQVAHVREPSPNKNVYMENSFYHSLCGNAQHPRVYWKSVACPSVENSGKKPISAPESSLAIVLFKPIKGEVWKRGQNLDAIVEWVEGVNTAPTSYPKYLSLYFVDLGLNRVFKITEFNESKWRRWIFGIAVGDNLNVVPNLSDGFYYVQVCDSESDKKCSYTNKIEIKGQIGSFKFELSKPVVGEVWKRGESSKVIQWLDSDLPPGYPEFINIYVLDSRMHRVFTVATYNPSINSKWTFGYKVLNNANLVPDSLADGSYYIQIVDSNNPALVATSKMIEISGGSDYKPK
eukprot:NODE_426_length_8844_cov_0.449857.p2 type:complete len:338 gc:universal NODE_426_length_8844_cov_0.449857:6272-7285(+)